MNNPFNNNDSGQKHHRFWKNSKGLAISLVILFEILALALFVVHAWVETVSSIKIINEANTVSKINDTYVLTKAMIGNKQGTIDLTKYFKPAGDMHFTPASSADGKTLFFPQANKASGFFYRKGNVNDKNTTYLSATFKLQTDTNADFFFTPAIEVSDDIRVSVTAYTEGENPEGMYDASTEKLITNTKIYANKASTAAVVNAASGATGATVVEKFADHEKGKSSTYRLFAVGANETKIVTINVWLQKKTSDNTDLTNSMSVSQAIKNLGITSSLTPRHVTLIPTPTWDAGTNEYFYAWCWGAKNGDASRLYKLELDGNEHYGFDYNGTYQNTLFLRSGKSDLTKEYLEAHWNDNTVWNKTEDTSIPNDPVDPTYIIETIGGSSEHDDSHDHQTDPNGYDSNAKKSTGSWRDSATIRVAFVNDQTTDWGTLTATSYVGTTTASHVIETTNSNSQKHKDTVHAWPGKMIQLTATAKTNYAFAGWYDNADGTGTALSTNATFTPNAPSTATEKVYYAKFKERRTLTINRLVDGNADSAVAAGTITINSTTSGDTDKTFTKTFDKGTSVSYSAAAKTGYTLEGIFTAAIGGTKVYKADDTATSITLNDNTTYYARFETNSYDVTASAGTGGEVKAGEAAKGTTSTDRVRYNSTISLVATPSSGYEFEGWYTDSGFTNKISNADATYSYKLTVDNDVTLYAKFIKLSTVTIYIAPRENWGNPDLHIWDDKKEIKDHLTASYDGTTGYYKATVQTSGTWLKVVLSKDSSYTSQTSEITVVSNISAETDYSKFIDTSNNVSNWSSTKRCVWFIITEDWIVNNIKNDKDWMRIWTGFGNSMRRINDNAYVCEFSSTPSDTIYFQQMYKDNSDTHRNEWSTTVPTGKSQYKETSYNDGAWQ